MRTAREWEVVVAKHKAEISHSECKQQAIHTNVADREYTGCLKPKSIQRGTLTVDENNSC